MISPTLTSLLMYTTVIIKAKSSAGEYSVGTAFYFNYKIADKKYILSLVTNKHVVEDAVEITAIVQDSSSNAQGKKGPANKGFLVNLSKWGDDWIKHPDHNIDLCCTVINPNSDVAKRIYWEPIAEDFLQDDESLGKLQALEDVLMVGYPLGRYDSKHNLPIFRKGITASHPAIDFNEEPKGLCDISVYNGSSGSPILIVNQGSYATQNGIQIGSRLVMLGILFGYFPITIKDDDTIKEIPTEADMIGERLAPANLGVYIKAKELLKMKAIILEKYNVTQ